MKKIFAVWMALILVLSLAACGENGNTTGSTQGNTAAPLQLNMTELYTNITKDATMPEMIQVGSDMLLDLYGIRPEDCKQSLVYICSNSLQADEIWLLEAKDAATVETLKNLAQSRIDQKDAESITYSPAQNEIVKKAQIIVVGNYLVMICSPDVEAMAAAFRTAAGI